MSKPLYETCDHCGGDPPGCALCKLKAVVEIGVTAAQLERLAAREIAIKTAEVSLQRLSDCGINPFAAQLLWESWKGHPNPKSVSFVLRGVRITIEAEPT